jgi:hypothetical protein
MIVRSAIICNTCGKPHVIRIGMGQEEHQSHRFPCRGCGEDIGVGLQVDYANVGAWPLAELNCTLAEEKAGAEIVNLDPNFVIPVADQGRDMTFSRLNQMRALVKKAIDRGVDLNDPKLHERPLRRPDYNAEWLELRRAWTLHRRGQDALSRGVIKKATAKLYPEDPLEGLPDWLFRLSLFLAAPHYYPLLKAMIERVKPVFATPGFKAFTSHYSHEMAGERGRKYLSIMTEYFGAYAEFSQVQLLVTNGLPVPPGHRVTSGDFGSTRMFYGNAFEAHADLVDLIAMLNNLLQGREYNVFEQLTLKQYYQIDKSGRSNCFANEPDLAVISAEADNQLRNASHHGGMDFDSATQMIIYRAGKGGTGPEQQVTYTEYLVRCVRLFMQIMTLLQFELMIAQPHEHWPL